jgi:hypothetical protein
MAEPLPESEFTPEWIWGNEDETEVDAHACGTIIFRFSHKTGKLHMPTAL